MRTKHITALLIALNFAAAQIAICDDKDKKDNTATPTPTPPVAAVDVATAQKLLVGTWEVPNVGYTLSFDAQNNMAQIQKTSLGTHVDVGFTYRIATDEKSHLLFIYVTDAGIEDANFAIISIDDNNLTIVNKPAARGIEGNPRATLKRTSKEPSPLAKKQK